MDGGVSQESPTRRHHRARVEGTAGSGPARGGEGGRLGARAQVTVSRRATERAATDGGAASEHVGHGAEDSTRLVPLYPRRWLTALRCQLTDQRTQSSWAYDADALALERLAIHPDGHKDRHELSPLAAGVVELEIPNVAQDLVEVGRFQLAQDLFLGASEEGLHVAEPRVGCLCHGRSATVRLRHRPRSARSRSRPPASTPGRSADRRAASPCGRYTRNRLTR